MTDEYFTPEQLAKRWGIHYNTLYNWRTSNKGPRFTKLFNNNIIYKKTDIDIFEKKTFLEINFGHNKNKRGKRYAKSNSK
jgi:hypothetical protein